MRQAAERLVIQLRVRRSTSAKAGRGADGHTAECVRLASGGRRPSVIVVRIFVCFGAHIVILSSGGPLLSVSKLLRRPDSEGRAYK